MTAPAPAPEPSGGLGDSLAGAWDTVTTAPRWVIVSVVVGGGVLAYVLIRTRQGGTTGGKEAPGNKTWRQQATDMLISRGYPPQQVQAAMTHYFDGGALSPQDSALISTAIMSLGYPDTPGESPGYRTSNPITDPGPGAPRGSNIGSSTGGVGNSGTPDYDQNSSVDMESAGNWYVVSMGFGWTSTLRGIAANFYGNPSLGNRLLAYNTNIGSDYERIPPGKKLTVPRQLQN